MLAGAERDLLLFFNLELHWAEEATGVSAVAERLLG